MEKRHNYVRKVGIHSLFKWSIWLTVSPLFKWQKTPCIKVAMIRLPRWQCSCSSRTTSPTAPDSSSRDPQTSRLSLVSQTCSTADYRFLMMNSSEGFKLKLLLFQAKIIKLVDISYGGENGFNQV